MNNELKAVAVLTIGDPKTKNFGQMVVKQTATRNMDIHSPTLLLAFSVWVLWSVVVVRMPDAGFHF